MKVLLLVEACAAGVGRHVIDLARGLAAEGHEIHLVYSSRRVDRAFVRSFNVLRAAFPSIAALDLSMRRKPHVSDLPAAVRLRRYVRKNGPFATIHAHSTKAGLLARTALAGLPGARVYTPHAPLTMNPDLKPAALRALRIYERALARFTHSIIAVSPEELLHMRALGIPEEKLFLVPNGIDSSGPAQQRRRNSEAPLCIGFMGRLAPQKDIPMLLAAFAQVLQTAATPVVLAIAGSGELRQSLEALARQLGIADHVRWLGESNPAILESFDVFALPSRYEGLPYVLLESMRAGLPAVCTRVGGIGLLVAEGVNGWTVPVGDVKAFAAALSALAGDPGLRERMGEAARARVCSFSLRRMIEGTLKVYEASCAISCGYVNLRTAA